MPRTAVIVTLLLACVASPPLAAQHLIHEWVSDPIPPDTNFGFGAVSSLGDVDFDGQPDVLIGSTMASSNGLRNNGRTDLYSGRSGLRLFSVVGIRDDEFLGWGLPVRDFDGDGRADFLLAHSVLAGNRYFIVWDVRSGLDGSTLRAASGLSTSATSLRDLDGDGVTDFLFVDLSWTPPGATDPQGRAELRSGRTDAVLHVFIGQSYVEAITHTLPVGDVDGDGFDDLLFLHIGDWPYVGASGTSVFSGRPPYALIHRIWPQRGSDSFGFYAVGPGDLDGDGYADIAISDRQYRVTNPDALVYLFSGRTGAVLHVLAPAPWMSTYQFGDLLAAPGDVDGDGCDDVAVTFGDAALRYAGIAVFSGRDASMLAIIRVPGWPHHAGDLDQDDFPDLLVGNLGTVVNNQLVDRRVRAYSLRPDGVDVLGQGCAPAGSPVPRIGCTRSPLLGSIFEVHVSRTRDCDTAALVLGFSSTNWAGRSLPFDLGTLGFSGCSLLTSADIVTSVSTHGVPGNAHATLALQLPADPVFGSMRFFLQWIVLQPPGIAVTRALECVLH